MGWWKQSRKGASLSEGGGEWGDGPADVISAAVDEVVKEFVRDLGRKPSRVELRAGLEFHIRAQDDLPEEPPE